MSFGFIVSLNTLRRSVQQAKVREARHAVCQACDPSDRQNAAKRLDRFRIELIWSMQLSYDLSDSEAIKCVAPVVRTSKIAWNCASKWMPNLEVNAWVRVFAEDCRTLSRPTN